MPDESLRVPSWCPLCQNIMKGSKSNNTFYNFGCCVGCFIEFIEGREERWKSGWRPSSEQILQYLKRLEPEY